MARLSQEQFRDDMDQTLKRVAQDGEPVILHDQDEDVAVLVSLADCRLLVELEDAVDRAAIRQAREEIAREGTVSWDQPKAECDVLSASLLCHCEESSTKLPPPDPL